MDYQLILYNSRKSYLIPGIWAILFLIFFLWLSIGLGVSKCFWGVLVSGGILALFIYRSNRISEIEPVIIVNTEGITNFRWRWKFVPWEDIVEIWSEDTNEYGRGPNYSFLFIQLKNPDKYISQMSLVERMLWWSHHWLGTGHLAFGTTGLTGSIKDVCRHITKLNTAGKISVSIKNDFLSFPHVLQHLVLPIIFLGVGIFLSAGYFYYFIMLGWVLLVLWFLKSKGNSEFTEVDFNDNSKRGYCYIKERDDIIDTEIKFQQGDQIVWCREKYAKGFCWGIEAKIIAETDKRIKIEFVQHGRIKNRYVHSKNLIPRQYVEWKEPKNTA